MNKEEFLEELSHLENRINDIAKEYLNVNAPFKVGDIIVSEDDEVGKIIRFKHNGSGYISADWCQMKKDGTFRQNPTHLSCFRLYKCKLFNK